MCIITRNAITTRFLSNIVQDESGIRKSSSEITSVIKNYSLTHFRLGMHKAANRSGETWGNWKTWKEMYYMW